MVWPNGYVWTSGRPKAEVGEFNPREETFGIPSYSHGEHVMVRRELLGALSITAAGLVVEQGGILSHGSIVAREYGLPAVTNVASATRVIRTGNLIQVDGIRGVVKVLDTAPKKTLAQ